MPTLLLYLIVGWAAISLFLVGAFIVTLNKMVTDEMRARLDDIPAVLVALAVRLAPADQREFLRVDWVDNLLVAFDEKNARYPVSRIFRSLPFVLPLFGTANGLRRQARAARRQAGQDEKLERRPGGWPDLVTLAWDKPSYTAGETMRVILHRHPDLHTDVFIDAPAGGQLVLGGRTFTVSADRKSMTATA